MQVVLPLKKEKNFKISIFGLFILNPFFFFTPLTYNNGVKALVEMLILNSTK